MRGCAGVSDDAPASPCMALEQDLPRLRRSSAALAPATFLTCCPWALLTVPLPTPSLSPLGKENCSDLFCPNTRSLQTPLEVWDREPGVLQVSVGPRLCLGFCVPQGQRSPVQLLSKGSARHRQRDSPVPVASAWSPALGSPSHSPTVLIPPKQAFIQETDNLEMKPLMLSNQQKHWTAFPADGNWFAATADALVLPAQCAAGVGSGRDGHRQNSGDAF